MLCTLLPQCPFHCPLYLKRTNIDVTMKHAYPNVASDAYHFLFPVTGLDTATLAQSRGPDTVTQGQSKGLTQLHYNPRGSIALDLCMCHEYGPKCRL